MIIWIVFFLIVLWVNLPSIVQKRLTNKFINRDYGNGVSPIRTIEWFHLYPLKKLLLALVWLASLYPAIRGIVLVWVKNQQEFQQTALFFILIPVFTAYPIWKYVKRPYHCAVVLNRFFSREELEEKLKNEKFELVKFENPHLQKSVHMFTSKNWLVIDGTLYAKGYMKNIQYTWIRGKMNIWVTYYNDKGLLLSFPNATLSRDRGEEMKRTLDRIMEREKETVKS